MVTAIVQARMGSSRLPGKTLVDVAGKPMMQRVIDRLRRSKYVEEIVIATTDQAVDDVLADFARVRAMRCFRGSEMDVLDRFYGAARQFLARDIVRVTPDCPLLDPAVVDRVVEAYLERKHDYVSNVLRYTYPEGLDVEAFSFEALERAWKETELPSDREHVTTYIRNSGRFRLLNVEGPTDHSQFKWSVDTEDDLKFTRSVYEHLRKSGDLFSYQDVLALLRDNPELQVGKAKSVVNAGYYKSLVRNPPEEPRQIPLTRSEHLKAKAQRLIPSCTQTFSKGPTQFIQGVAPVFLERGQGSHVWDVDGNEFIDYPMGLGPVILGHNHPSVTEAAEKQMRQGLAFSLPHPLEAEVAQALTELFPCAEMVRFGKNGSDATSGAVRVARAFTGRDLIACCGYHGWQDWYIGTTTRNAGVPRGVQALTRTFKYNDFASLERIFEETPGQVAAVIMEPIGVVHPEPRFLERIRDLTSREGALLIFDEVVTGFRIAMGGAQEYFGVKPDLACIGKAMANGFPLAAVVGRRDVMERFDDVFFSFTFGGEAVSLAASLATINEIRSKNVIAHLWAQGRKLQDGYNGLAAEYGVEKYTQCLGLPPRTVISFKSVSGEESLVLKSLFQQECLKRGILFSGGQNICYAHSDSDIDRTLRVYRTALETIADAIRKGDAERRLEGTPVQPVFRSA